MAKESVEQEIENLESYIDKKVEEKVKVVSNKWASMGAKQKLDFVFVTLGCIAFGLTIITNLKKVYSGGGEVSHDGGGMIE